MLVLRRKPLETITVGPDLTINTLETADGIARLQLITPHLSLELPLTEDEQTVLSSRAGRVVIKVLDSHHSKGVRIGIDAPASLLVLRSELANRTATAAA